MPPFRPAPRDIEEMPYTLKHTTVWVRENENHSAPHKRAVCAPSREILSHENTKNPVYRLL